jgi:hypothetical protein
MKYHVFIWKAMTTLMKPGLKKVWEPKAVPRLIADAKPIYKDLLSKVEGVSDDNPMAGNITMAFVFIAIWLASERKITPKQMSQAVSDMLSWKPLHWYYGHIDMNTKKGVRSFEKMIRKGADWAAAHPEDNNTWDFHFDETLHRDGFYYHFTHCPIADFCKKYGYEEINPILCDIDFITMGMMHSVLHREHTLASGGSICDYWTVGDKIKNPR